MNISIKQRKAVFLDRDGVLNCAEVRNGKPFPPTNLRQLKVITGVEEAVRLLKKAGFVLIVVTNQPDVARGTITKDAVEEINQYLAKHLGIDEFRTCYHDSGDGCLCRKPLPGGILDAAKFWFVDLQQSFMVGDRWRDILAGQAAGVKTIFIDYGYDEKQPESYDFRASNLLDAVPFILRENS